MAYLKRFEPFGEQDYIQWIYDKPYNDIKYFHIIDHSFCQRRETVPFRHSKNATHGRNSETSMFSDHQWPGIVLRSHGNNDVYL